MFHAAELKVCSSIYRLLSTLNAILFISDVRLYLSASNYEAFCGRGV